jgi:hypothetical protein
MENDLKLRLAVVGILSAAGAPLDGLDIDAAVAALRRELCIYGLRLLADRTLRDAGGLPTTGPGLADIDIGD